MNVQRFGFEICLLRRPESHTRTCWSKFWLNPRTLTEAGYARCGNENQPTVLSWILLPDLPHLLDGTVCHACILFFDTFCRMRWFTLTYIFKNAFGLLLCISASLHCVSIGVKQPFYHQYNYTFYSMLICTCGEMFQNWYACVARSASCEWLIISLCK